MTDPRTNIIQFIAPGGTGKTMLVTYWLQTHLPKSGSQFPEMIYAWSFYSQGSDESRQSSANLFFQRAADFLGLAPLPIEPRERGLTLALALRRHRCLLILDGIEPLQHPPGPLEGELKDPALRTLLKKLGGFGWDLIALSHLFERPWDKPSQNLSKTDQAAVLSWVGFRLRGLGRLRESIEPMKASLKLSEKQNDWRGAAQDASNISEAFLTLGALQEAVEYGRLTVEYADLSGDDFWKLATRTAYADALNQTDNSQQAKELFAEAESIQIKSQPEYCYLYSMQGYRYCDFLLGLGKMEEVVERAILTLEWVKKRNLLLDIALDQLSLGRAFARLDYRTPNVTYHNNAEYYLKQAMEGFDIKEI